MWPGSGKKEDGVTSLLCVISHFFATPAAPADHMPHAIRSDAILPEARISVCSRVLGTGRGPAMVLTVASLWIVHRDDGDKLFWHLKS